MARKKKCVACECKDQMIVFLTEQLEDAKTKLWSLVGGGEANASVAAATKETDGNVRPKQTSAEDALNLLYQDIGEPDTERPARDPLDLLGSGK